MVFKSGKRRRSLKSGESRLKVVIMSATMDVDHFSKYFKFGFHGIFFIFIFKFFHLFKQCLLNSVSQGCQNSRGSFTLWHILLEDLKFDLDFMKFSFRNPVSSVKETDPIKKVALFAKYWHRPPFFQQVIFYAISYRIKIWSFLEH